MSFTPSRNAAISSASLITSRVSIIDSYNAQGKIAITGLPWRVTVTASGSSANRSGRCVISSRISEIEYVFPCIVGNLLVQVIVLYYVQFVNPSPQHDPASTPSHPPQTQSQNPHRVPDTSPPHYRRLPSPPASQAHPLLCPPGSATPNRDHLPYHLRTNLHRHQRTQQPGAGHADRVLGKYRRGSPTPPPAPPPPSPPPPPPISPAPPHR